MLPAAALRTGQEAITLTEIELKLSAAPGDLPALMQALEALGKRTSTTASLLTSTYYDSPDLKLQQRHLTLRVREQGAQYVQTVKSGDLMEADFISRGEWEDLITGNEPDLDAPQTGHRLKQKVEKGELRPLFTTIVRRTVIQYRRRGSKPPSMKARSAAPMVRPWSRLARSSWSSRAVIPSRSMTWRCSCSM